MNFTNVPYKLEQHLKDICAEHPEYNDLLATWQINKKSCNNLLRNVNQNYPHFTEHGGSHSESIITNIEMLLGEESIRKLSPTDTWLLLQVAYMHDLGMVLLYDNLEETWGMPEFQTYLKKLQQSNDTDLKHAAEYINNLANNLQSEKFDKSWPLSIRRYVSIIISSYYRGKHASLSEKYLYAYGKDWGLDLEFNGLIQERLIRLLGKIAYVHTEDSEKVLELDYKAKGFNSDYIHPRFIAEMLRMGDLLDADNNRFNVYSDAVNGKAPESSDVHRRKHRAVTHILVTPETIEYCADCPDTATYREARNFLTWLENEVKFLALNWNLIMPKEVKGTAPRLEKQQLLLEGEPDLDGLSDLKFQISQKRAFEIIEGSNIYSEGFVFIRELVQNAMDACKIQMYRDIREGKYRAWIEEKEAKSLLPWDIPKKVYQNYKVDVYCQDIDEDYFELVVSDNGIGMTIDTFKEMCNVGESYHRREGAASELEDMPLWLRPTAGFGIGLQSVFLVCDEFEIITKTERGGLHARIESGKEHGYIQLKKDTSRRYNGTDIKLRINRHMNFRFSWNGKADKYIKLDYDPFEEVNRIAHFRIVDELEEAFKRRMFKISAYSNGKIINKMDCNNIIEKAGWVCKNKRYLEKIDEKQQYIELWDVETCTYLKIQPASQYGTITKIFLKGVNVSKSKGFDGKYVHCLADFYGFDTGIMVTLDRDHIKKSSEEKVRQIIDDGIQYYRDIVWNNLISEDSKLRIRLDNLKLLYHWAGMKRERKIALIKKEVEYFDSKIYMVDVLELNGNEEYNYNTITIKELIDNISKTAYVFLHQWDRSACENEKERRKKCLKRIQVALGDLEKKEYKYILVDEEFITICLDFYKKSLQLISGNKLLIGYGEKEDNLTVTDKYSKQRIMNLILKDNNYQTKRKYLPIIRGYERLTVKNDSLYMSSILNIGLENYIIAPLTSSDRKGVKRMRERDFIESVTSRPDYKKLLEYVYDNQIIEKQYTIEELDECYRKLIGEIYVCYHKTAHKKKEKQ